MSETIPEQNARLVERSTADIEYLVGVREKARLAMEEARAALYGAVGALGHIGNLDVAIEQLESALNG